MAYLLIASISIFMNFNAIYMSLSSQQIGNKNYIYLKGNLFKIIGKIQNSLSNQINIKEKDLEKAKTEMEFEAVRIDRPGKGQRYLILQEKYEIEKSNFKIATDELRNKLNKIKQIESDINQIKSPETFQEAKKCTNELIKIAMKISSQGFNYSELEEIINNNTNMISLEYSLSVIIEEIKKIVISNELDGKTFYRFVLSLILSLMIDLSVFFGLILSRQQAHPTFLNKPQFAKEQQKSMWEEKLW